MPAYNKTGQADTMPGSGADLALHPKLWGQPMPRWTDTGMVYVEGSHWSPEVYEALVLWLGIALDAMHLWVYGPDPHRDKLILRKRIALACAEARTHHLEGDAYSKMVDGILPSIVLTAPEREEIDHRVIHAERARKHLWSIASSSDPRTRPNSMDELAQWVTKRHIELVLRLAQVDLVPRPPASILPSSMPKHGPNRQARLDSKPSADPEKESPF